LIDNEVGALFLEPAFHGQGLGLALMNKARDLHGKLEVEVFSNNAIGRKFYARYGFTHLRELVHEDTGYTLLRLQYTDPGAN